MTYYYARVSSRNQSLLRQIEQFKALGAEDRYIITEKKSGKNIEDREAYKAMRNQMLRCGDTLIVCSIDRLGRNKQDIKKELEYYRENNIRVKILDLPTTAIEVPHGQEWVLDMVSNILIEVYGSLAQHQREDIREKQAQGIAAAKAKGTVKFGRPCAKKPKNWDAVIEQWKNKKITAVQAMEELQLKKSTFYKLLKDESL